MRKKIIIIAVILITALIFGYNYIYRDHRDINSESAEFIISTDQIASEFLENSESSEQKYLNKTIEVSGLISELNNKDITLDDKVFCQFLKEIQDNLSLNSEVKIKGRVIGYDDLLEQVKLDQCAIIK